jgi:hypothetical protein
MSSIENTFAAIFFAELLLPLRHANLRSNIAYLDRGRKRESYWSGIATRTGGIERLSSTGCNAAVLLGLLGSYWERSNERNLLQLLPHLERLRQELGSVASMSDQAEQLTEFIYPLS